MKADKKARLRRFRRAREALGQISVNIGPIM